MNVIDLSRNHFERTVSDITIRGIWIPFPDNGDEATEPALAITAAFRQSKPWIIGLSAAFKYDNPRYMARVSKDISDSIGLEPNVFTWAKIAKVIDDHLSDLISMPPRPVNKILAAEGNMHIDGKNHSIQLFDTVSAI